MKTFKLWPFAMLVASAPCFAVKSPVAGLPRKTALPFERSDCESFILGEAGRAIRTKYVDLLSGWDFEMKPSNSDQTVPRLQTMTPHFAVWNAPTGTPRAELEQILRSAELDARQTRDAIRDMNETVATPLSHLQNAALGITVPSSRPSIELDTRLVARDGHLRLETRDGERPIGAVELDLGRMELGYLGSPEYWIYSQKKDGVEDDEIDAHGFLEEHCILLLRPAHLDKPFVYVLEIHVDHDSNTFEMVTVDVFWERRVHPALVDEGDLQVPPLLGPDGLAAKFVPVHLRLTTEF